jgi:hypothetical protein
MKRLSPEHPACQSMSVHAQPRSLIACCLERNTLFFSLKMALVVGTLLAVINYSQALLFGHMTPGMVLALCLTYAVPFMVAMYSQVQGKRQRDHCLSASSEHEQPRKEEDTAD